MQKLFRWLIVDSFIGPFRGFIRVVLGEGCWGDSRQHADRVNALGSGGWHRWDGWVWNLSRSEICCRHGFGQQKLCSVSQFGETHLAKEIHQRHHELCISKKIFEMCFFNKYLCNSCDVLFSTMPCVVLCGTLVLEEHCFVSPCTSCIYKKLTLIYLKISKWINIIPEGYI